MRRSRTSTVAAPAGYTSTTSGRSSPARRTRTSADLTSGAGVTMGRFQITFSTPDFYVIHADSFGAIATTAQTLSYRKITQSTHTLESATAFSDTNGNPITVPRNTGTSKLYGC